MRQHGPQRICALRLPGTSRARFVDAGNVEVHLGDWVLIDAGPGEEPGQIVVAPDQWIEPVHMDDVPMIQRKLEESAIDQVASNIERARNLIDPAARVVRDSAPGTFLTGLRLTFSGDAAIVVYHGDEPPNLDEISQSISHSIGMPVSLEQDHPGDPERALLGGSIGVPRRPNAETFRELLEQRIDVLRQPGTFAPQGIPRLGSHVSTPDGEGTLVAVDIRHWKATVRLADGDETTYGVDDLAEP